MRPATGSGAPVVSGTPTGEVNCWKVIPTGAPAVADATSGQASATAARGTAKRRRRTGHSNDKRGSCSWFDGSPPIPAAGVNL